MVITYKVNMEGRPELSGTQTAVETGHGLEKQPGTTEPQSEPVVKRGIGRRGLLAGVALVMGGLLGNKTIEKPQGETK
jgi:hypothetical protein